MDNIRVRIAPSPTGDPHLGTAYIALFNYVFAKKHKGCFILRMEDTDLSRAKPFSEKRILDSLKWLGLNWDEGPDIGGDFGPYRQSERKEIYQSYIKKLLNKGYAYKCFCDKERLQELRRQQQLSGLPKGYDGFCRVLTQKEIDENLKKGLKYVIRMKMPKEGVTIFKDFIRGDISFDNHRLDDQVLIKSDMMPTYHFANVIDDHLMKISHVIRAEEWISSTPKHIILYNMFDWKVPQWIHMPLLRNQNKSKISKRNNPVSIDHYKRVGFLPQAMINFLALMGWSYGENQEVFSIDDMTKKLDFKKIHLGGPIFDIQKLYWLNKVYIKKMGSDLFAKYIREYFFSQDYLKNLYEMVAERLDVFSDFVDQNSFFFNAKLNIKLKDIIPKNRDINEVKDVLSEIKKIFEEFYDWNIDEIKKTLNNHKTKLNWKNKEYFMTIRMVLTGRKDSPPIFDVIDVLGKDIVLFRIKTATENG